MARESFEPGEDLSLEGFVGRAAIRTFQEREAGTKAERSMAYAYRMQAASLGMLQQIHLFRTVHLPDRKPRNPSRSEVYDGVFSCGLQHLVDNRLLSPYAACGRRAMQEGQAVLTPVRWDPASWGYGPSRDLRFRLRTMDRERVHDMAEECWISPSTLITICMLNGLAQSERWLVPDAWLLSRVVGAFFSMLAAEQQRLDHLLQAIGQTRDSEGAER